MDTFLLESNLNSIKNIARELLYVDILETPLSPLFVSHPIFESAFAPTFNDISINILESKESLYKAQKVIEKRIDIANSVFDVFWIINKPHRLMFLKFCKSLLSIDDFSKLLADVWISSENGNQDVYVDIFCLTSWFKSTDKKTLMTEHEYQIYKNLSEILTVYRGVGVDRNHNGISWTLDKNKAEWFAHRFDNKNKKGYLRTLLINKSYVLAYFNRAKEDEIVISADVL